MIAPEKTAEGKTTLQGTVKAANFGPRGEVDGLILDVRGQLVQVNVPPDRGDRVLGLVGQSVELEVGPEPKVAEPPKGAQPGPQARRLRGRNSRQARPQAAPPSRTWAQARRARQGEGGGCEA